MSDNFGSVMQEMNNIISAPSTAAPAPAAQPTTSVPSTPATQPTTSAPKQKIDVKKPDNKEPVKKDTTVEKKSFKIPTGNTMSALDDIYNDITEKSEESEFDPMNTDKHPMDDYELSADKKEVDSELDELKELSDIGEEDNREKEIDTTELDEQAQKESEEPTIVPLEEIVHESQALQNIKHYMPMVENSTSSLLKLMEDMKDFGDSDYASKSNDIQSGMTDIAAGLNNIIAFYDKLREMFSSKIKQE